MNLMALRGRGPGPDSGSQGIGSRRRLGILIIATITLAMACSGGADHRKASPKSESPAQASPELLSSRPCDNTFLIPRDVEPQVEYQTTFENGIQGYSFHVTFGQPLGGIFLEHEESSNGITQNRRWRCEAAGLLSEDVADLFLPQPRLKLETLSVSGIGLPDETKWQLGTKWKCSYSVKGQLQVDGVAKPLEVGGTITVSSEIKAFEPVAVPAGQYDACKVESTYLEQLLLSGSNGSRLNTTVDATTWFAKDVGIVKCTSAALRCTTVLAVLAASAQ